MAEKLKGEAFEPFDHQRQALLKTRDRLEHEIAARNDWPARKLQSAPFIFQPKSQIGSTKSEEALGDLFRALRRKKGFGLFFVQCSPAQEQQVITAIQQRFPQKRLEQFPLDRESTTLYGEMLQHYQAEPFDVACVTGVEQALFDYEDTKRLAGWSSREIYTYSWKGVPPLLSHLNRQREVFEANLPIALIFLVRSFVIDYFVQRAPDFFDWRSVFFKFTEKSENLKQATQDLVDKEYEEYLVLTSEQRVQKILEIQETINQLDPLDYEQKSNLLREQGRILASGGLDEQALEHCERALQENPKSYKAWLSRGNSLHASKRYEEAIESFDQAIRILPNDYFAWLQRGLSLHDLKRYEEAIESFDQAIKILPGNSDFWNSRGLSLYELKRYEEAIESFDQVIKIQPDNPHAWNGRRFPLLALKRYEEAIESSDQAIKIQPDNPHAWNSRGLSLHTSKRYEEAIESFDHAIKIQPNDPDAWNNRGFSLLALKCYEEAIASYDHAIKINPEDYFSWLQRGNSFYALKRYEKAIESYDHVLTIQPDDYYALNGRSRAMKKARKSLCEHLINYGIKLINWLAAMH